MGIRIRTSAFWVPGGCVALGVVIASLLGSCSSADYGDKPIAAVSVNVTDPTWDNGIGDLVARKCDNCHAKTLSAFVPGEIRDNPRRYALGFSESEQSFLDHGTLSYRRVFEDAADPMPPTYGTPLSADEKAALKKYLEDKVINASKDTSANRDAFLTETCAGVAANTLTYATDVSPKATSEACLSCHSAAPRNSGKIELTSATLWKEHRRDLVWALASPDASIKMPSGRADDYTAAGKPGEVFLKYLCGSAEMTAAGL